MVFVEDVLLVLGARYLGVLLVLDVRYLGVLLVLDARYLDVRYLGVLLVLGVRYLDVLLVLDAHYLGVHCGHFVLVDFVDALPHDCVAALYFRDDCYCVQMILYEQVLLDFFALFVVVCVLAFVRVVFLVLVAAVLLPPIQFILQKL